MLGKENIDKTLLEILNGKEVLFLENDYGLYNQVGLLENFCIDNKIKYHTILDIGNVPINSILHIIDYHDVIVWESQYVSEISNQLTDLITTKKVRPKILIECYVQEPRWCYKPKNTHHDFLVLEMFEDSEDDEFWQFDRLSDIPAWSKKRDEL